MNIVWLDLEMTGLDAENDRILEIAVTITDKNLQIIDPGLDLVIHQPPAILQTMNEWCRKQHAKSGLTREVSLSKITTKDAEKKVLFLIRKYGKKQKLILAGNTIWQDRTFMRRHMPKLEQYFYYRIIDVSTIKELVRGWYSAKLVPKKKGTHRAREDIIQSIKELKWYKENVFVKH